MVLCYHDLWLHLHIYIIFRSFPQFLMGLSLNILRLSQPEETWLPPYQITDHLTHDLPATQTRDRIITPPAPK